MADKKFIASLRAVVHAYRDLIGSLERGAHQRFVQSAIDRLDDALSEAGGARGYVDNPYEALRAAIRDGDRELAHLLVEEGLLVFKAGRLLDGEEAG